MKKNSLMRLAGLLLIMTLVTSCFVGGTFAKYTTSETGGDSARVAKFGVTITANGSTFAETYKTEDPEFTGTYVNSVISAEALNDQIDDSVIAPGTAGNMASMTLEGVPEVAVNVSYEAEVDLANWNIDGKVYYCPLVIKVNETEIKTGAIYDGITVFDEATFEQAVKAAIEDYSKSYPANTDLSEKGADSLKISWEWPFEGNDEFDTELGDQAAENNAATISLSIETTVTQID